MSATTDQRAGSAHDRRVPVEHRVVGLDRRTFGYAAAALLVYALWAWILPWVDGRVAWDDVTQPGDVLQVTPDLTMTPPTGWGVISGLRTDDRTASGETATESLVLTKDGIQLVVKSGAFDGTPAELLDRIDVITSTTNGEEGFKALTGAQTTTTSSGLTGVVEGFQSQRLAGVMAAFVVDGTGLEIQVVGPPDQMSQESETIGEMLDTLTPASDGSGS